ncbi:hypothetical protein VaNZ11_001033, partial [Volvox africanus]
LHQFPTCPIPSYILKMPPRKAPAPAAAPAPTPAESAVSLEFLRAFLRRIPGGANGGATIARVVEELIRPSTSATLSSYASQPFLVPRNHVSAPTWVVIHPWDLPLADLVAVLEEFTMGLPPASTYFWLRALAVSQHLMGANAALQPLEEIEGELAPAGGPPGETPAGAEAPVAAPATALGDEGQSRPVNEGGGDVRGMASAPSFGTMLRKRQTAVAARHKVAIRIARLEALAATRGAVAAARCGALLLVGRDVRPLRRGWCLVEAAEALRAKGPEAITVLPVDKAFTRGDLVRQLRELDVAEVVAEAEEHDKEVLAEVLGVPLPQPPAAPAPGGPANTGASIAASSDPAGQGRRRTSAADEQHPHPHSHPHPHTHSSTHPHHRASGSHPRFSRATGGGSGSGSGCATGLDPGEDDGYSGGRALARQLQLALLLRPMDGALPARMLGTPMGDAQPVATNSTARNSSSGPTAFATRAAVHAAAAAKASSSKVGTFALPGSACSFDWLWDWTPLTSWLALPPEHPSWQALLITGTHGSGKTTAMAALLSRLMAATTTIAVTRGSLAEAPLVACHFCSAADARSLVATEVVRSLAYQLSCRSPGFGAAVCQSLLQLGGAGGGLALTPDGWLQGLEETVAALLRHPMEQDAEARAARGDAPIHYLLVLDGLDEGPASAASSSVLMDSFTAEDTGPSACPGHYQVLRLLVDHLRHLPGVRLVLSCTEAADASSSAASGSGTGSAAVLPWRPFDLPPPLIVAPRIAADASTSVLLAVRQAFRPRELPLTSLRRDKHLPLALAHALQEYVLSPELTARELLWQARGCLAHVHILQLLVKHAAEQLGPAAGLPDGTVIAAAATAANAAVGGAAPPARGAGERPLAAATDAPTAAVLQALQRADMPLPEEPQRPLPPQPGVEPPQAQHQEQQRGSELPSRPRTPPRQDQAGFARQQSLRRPNGAASALDVVMENEAPGEAGVCLMLTEPQLPDFPSLAAPPTELAALNSPNTGDGTLGVHIIPPVSRGSLADEYGVLWHVRTAELQEAAMIALARGAEAAAEESPPSPQQNRTSPRRMDTMMMGLTAAQPPAPPYPPERAARLQLLVDVLAAAQEPLEWALLVCVMLAAEVPAGPSPVAAAPTIPAGGTASTPVRTHRADVRSPSPAALGDAAAAPGSPSDTRSRRESTPVSLRSGAGGDVGRLQQSRTPSRSEVEDVSRSVSPGVGVASQPVSSRAEEAAVGASALRDLEWALQEGPLAGLVWVSGCGRVTVRHSSFLDWLRRVSTVASASAATGGPTTAAAPAPAAAVAVPAVEAVGVATAVAEAPLSMPRAQRGHTVLARLLRRQLLSGRLLPAAAASAAAGAPLAAGVGGLRRPGSASNVLLSSLEAAGSASAVALGMMKPAQLSTGLGLGFGGDGGINGAGGSLGPPASMYCLRHVVTHCAEGRLPTSELETTIMDLDFWRQVLEGFHLEMVAASLEHLLRTRGPHSRRLIPPQQQQVLLQQQGTLPLGMLPRTPPPAGAAAALVRGTPAVTPSPQGSVSNANANASGGGSPAIGGATAGAVVVSGLLRDGRTVVPPPLPAATFSLLRDTLLWLLQDGRSLMRRPEPLMLACSASCTPLQSPFRRLAEQITTLAAAAAAAAAADSLFPPPPKLGAMSAAPLATPSPALVLTGGAAAAVMEPVFPPSFVTAMPHPRFRRPIMRATECPHRVAGLLASPDGELVLATAECASKASVLDTLSGRRALLLHAGRCAHHSALSAAAFAPSRALLATAGSIPGSVTLWDLTTGAPRATLQLRSPEPRSGPGDTHVDADAAAQAARPSLVLTSAIPSLASALPSAGPSLAISTVYPAPTQRGHPSSQHAVSIAALGEGHARRDPSAGPDVPRGSSTMTHASQPSLAFSSDDPYVTCIAVYEPGPAASATAYGAPMGARVVQSSAAAAASAAEGNGVAIVRGSALVAAGDSSSGRVVLWAVAPDGWGASRTAELVPPTGVSALHGGGGVAWLGFLPGGKSLLVVQSCSTTLRVWNVQSHNITATLHLPAACGEIFGVHIAPKCAADTAAGAATAAATLIAAVCTSSTELRALDGNRPLASLPFGAGGEGGGRNWADNCVAFSPAGGLLATAGAMYGKQLSTAGSCGATSRGGTPAVTATRAVAENAQQLVADHCAATLWDARSGAQVTQLRGMRSAIRALAFSPDGALLAAAVADAAVVLWSAATGACLSVLAMAEEVMDVPAVVFARQGAVLMAAGGSAVYTWDVQLAVAAAGTDAAAACVTGSGFASGTPASRNRTPLGGGGAVGGGSRRAMNPSSDVCGHRDRVAAVCFSPNGALALTGGDDSTIRLWDVVRHTELVEVEQPGAVLALAWSPDGTLIAAGLSNGTAHVWYFGAVTAASMDTAPGAAIAAAAAAIGDFTTREAARLRCSGSGGDEVDDVSTTMNAVSFSADGKLFLTGNGEGRVSVWSVRDWQQVSTALPSVRPSRTAISRGAPSADGDGGAAGSSVFGSGTMVGRYAGASFSADGRWVLMGCGREVMLWSVKSKRESSGRLGPHGAPVVAVVASPCGKLAAVGAGSSVTIWGRPDAIVGGTGGGAAAGGVGGGTSRTSGAVSFRTNPSDGAGGGPASPFSARVTLLPALAEVTGLAFSADGTMLAASLGDGSVRVWDTGRWKEVGWLSAHGAAATSVVFSPNGMLLLSAGADSRCLAWSTRDVLQPVFGSAAGALEGE